MAKKRSRASYRRAALRGWATQEFNRRSAAAKLGWKRRRRKEQEKKRARENRKLARKSLEKRQSRPRKPKEKAQTLPPLNREYFVVLLFQTRKNGKPATRRLREAIVTLPDGASENEIKKAYADWMLQNQPQYSAQDIFKLVFAENRGRKIDIRIIPRDEPTEQPEQIRDNDARSRTPRPKRKAKKRKG